MLTVLHRKPDGSERIFEAESVTRFPPEGEESIPAMGKVVALLADGGDSPSSCAELSIAQPFGAVFVMNRFGVTVASYRSA